MVDSCEGTRCVESIFVVDGQTSERATTEDLIDPPPLGPPVTTMRLPLSVQSK